MSDDKKIQCVPNPGTRGEPWRAWTESWTEFAQAQFEYQDDFSWLDVTEGRDQGAVNGPALAGGGAAATEGARKRKKRQLSTARGLSMLQTDPRLRKLLISLPPGNNVTNDANGDGIGRRAWLLLTQECGEQMTSLEIRTRKKEYSVVSIRASIGFSQTSITDLNRELAEINFKIPANRRFDDTEQTERVLECIRDECPDPALALEAGKELQAEASRIFVVNGAALPNNRDLNAAITYFDRMWSQLVKVGKIRVSAASGKRAETTTLVATGNSDQPFQADSTILITEDGNVKEDNIIDELCAAASDMNVIDLHELLAMMRNRRFPRRGFGTSVNTPLSLEAICTICLGFGHLSKDCISSQKVRPVKDAIVVLQKAEEVITRRQSGQNASSSGDSNAANETRFKPRPPQSTRPYGTRPLSTSKRVSIAGGKAKVRVAEHDDKEESDARIVEIDGHQNSTFEEFMMDIDQTGGGEKRDSDQMVTRSGKKAKQVELQTPTFVQLIPYQFRSSPIRRVRVISS